MTIREFPLAWRWTDPRYAVFPPEVLAQLYPCPPEEAFLLFKCAGVRSRSIDPAATRISADNSPGQVSAWLEARQPRLTEEVVVCWSPELALRTRWSTFIKRWDDLCYPSSDDVTVFPNSGSWLLMYHHWHEFEFRAPEREELAT
jgi:hypothetical protein